MPTASGSLAFLGAARFQGYWDATKNSATGSGLPGQKLNGVVNGLFSTGSSANVGGYANATGLTASVGDYWQVTGSGTHNVDGTTSWALNDWCVYSGSAGSSGNWSKLSFDDTIASIILGDLSASSFHIGSATNDKHIIFATGSVHSGSSNFTYDYTNNRVGIGTGAPAKHLHINGTSGEVELRIQSSNKFSSIVQKDNAELIIQNASAGDIIFYDDSAERMRIKDGGKVGIGSTAPEHTLSITGTLGVSGNTTVSGTFYTTNIQLSDTAAIKDASGHTRITFTDAGDMQFNDEAGNSVMFVDTNSRVGIGTSSPDHDLEVVSAGPEISIAAHSDSTSNQAELKLKKSRGTEGSPTIVVEDDPLGDINWYGYNSDSPAGFDEAASIRAFVDGEPGSSTDNTDMPARIEFGTSPDGAAATVTRMTIKSDGKVGVASSSPEHILSVTGTLGVSGDTTVSGSLYGTNITASTNISASAFYGDGANLTNLPISAVANGADNRLATFSSAAALNGEANLTFNGSTNLLTVGGNITGSQFYGGNIYNKNDADTYIDFEGASNQINLFAGGFVHATFYGPSGGQKYILLNALKEDIDFKVHGDNTSDLLKVDAGLDKVGIATSSPEHILSVTGTLGVSGDTTVSGTLYANHLTASTISSSFYGDGAHLSNVPSVANGANDRIATFSSADALNGEANLTFNSSNLLTVAGNITASTNVSASAFYGQEAHSNSNLLLTNNAGASTLIVTNNAGGGDTESVVLQPLKTNRDIIFKEDGGNEIARFDSSAESLKMATSKKIEFGDSGESISGDGSDLTIISGRNIILSSSLSNGKAGIKTTSPEHTLSVTGTLGVSGDTAVSGTIYAANVSASTNVSASAFYGNGANLTSLPVTALNNQSVNRLVTIGSTTTQLDGEANLTFDGSTLALAGNTTVTPGASGGDGITVTHTDVDKHGIKVATTNATTGAPLFIDHNDSTTVASAQKVSFVIDFDKTGIQAQSTTASYAAQEITMLDAADNHAGGTVHMTGSSIIVSSSYNGGLATTNTGLRVETHGADSNYDALFLGGNVGIGTATPASKLSILADEASNTAAHFFNDGNNANRYGISVQCGLDTSDGTAPTSNLWAVLKDGNGTDKAYIAWVNGSSNAGFVAASDRRIKTDIAPTKVNALEVINNIPLSEFRMAKKNEPVGDLVKVGFIAQDCELAWPEMVTEWENEDYDHKVKAVSPATLIPVLVKAVQELSAEVQALKAK